jgi:SAM-dependent methyltransferase
MKPLTLTEYWDGRYQQGWTPVPEKVPLQEYKATYINNFIAFRRLKSVLDLGCGEGTQSHLMVCDRYIGADVSPTAIKKARKANLDKEFLVLPTDLPSVDITISLDVIYHLVYNDDYQEYMNTLFDRAEQYVIMYTSDPNKGWPQPPTHIRHRNVVQWALDNTTGFELYAYEKNPFPYFVGANENTTSWSDFYVYKRLLGVESR